MLHEILFLLDRQSELTNSAFTGNRASRAESDEF